MNGKVTRVVEASKRTGSSTGKDGKPFTWNIMSVEVQMPDGSLVIADSFDTLADGDTVAVETKTTEKDGKTYTNINASLPKTNPYGAKTAAQNNAEVMQAIRLTFQLLKTVDAKLSKLMGVDAELFGAKQVQPAAATPGLPAEPVYVPPPEAVPPVDPAELSGKPWDKWAAGDTPATRPPDTVVDMMDPDEPINLDDIPFN